MISEEREAERARERKELTRHSRRDAKSQSATRFCRFIPQASLDFSAIQGVPNTSGYLSFSQRLVHIISQV